MIDGFFPSNGAIRLEETRGVLARYANVIPYLAFTPVIVRDIKTISDDATKWYVTKYDDMNVFRKLLFDDKKVVEDLNNKIQKTESRHVAWHYHPLNFLKELYDYKQLPPHSNSLEALESLCTNFKLEDWTRFLRMTLTTNKVYESITALYYECSLINRQLGGFDVLANLKYAFQIPNDFIKMIALRITFIYKENAEHSFSESLLGSELGRLNGYILADGKEPITLIEKLIEEENEPILRAILKEFEIKTIDGLIHSCLNNRQAKGAEFLLRFPHDIEDDKVRAIATLRLAPQRKNTTVNTDETELGFYFMERNV